MLTIPMETLAFIIVKAREFDAEAPPVDVASGSNAADDHEVDILEDSRNNPTRAELRGALRALNSDEMDEILAQMWLGRGDFSKEEWSDALAQAREQRNARNPEYLIGTPLLAEYLEDALSELGLSIEDFEINRL